MAKPIHYADIRARFALSTPRISYRGPTGPCALESRVHALEMSRALAGMAAGLAVERSFAWLCRNRRLAKDFETRVDNAAADLQLAMIKRLTRRLATVGQPSQKVSVAAPSLMSACIGAAPVITVPSMRSSSP